MGNTLKVLVQHIRIHHKDDEKLDQFLTKLRQELVFDTNVNPKWSVAKCDKIIQCTTPSVFNVNTPTLVCDILDGLFTEIGSQSIPNLCWRGEPDFIGAISVETAAERIYSTIAKGECVTFLDINTRCEEHSQQC